MLIAKMRVQRYKFNCTLCTRMGVFICIFNRFYQYYGQPPHKIRFDKGACGPIKTLLL